MKLLVFVLFEYDNGETEEYQVSIDSREVISFQVPEPIELSELNMKIQDNFHFVDAVIGALVLQDIDIPDRNHSSSKCLVIEAGNLKLDKDSQVFRDIFSDFNTDL
tara:strand:+ start:875 stop:1192 length:318 start_codon:yes stop_codon:yes gene_type:complete